MVLKVDYLIVSNGLQHYCCRIDYEAQQLYFSAGYTRVSKLIGGATNSPLASHLIASYTMRDMRAMMFALSSSVSYESMTKAAM